MSLCAAGSLLHGQTPITLSPSASPASGQPGVTPISITGSGFPTGTIQPSAVTVSLTPSAGGASVAAAASAVATIVGSTRRVTFTIPASISISSPTQYSVTVQGATTANVSFASSNSATLTVNPSAKLLSITPAKGLQGQTISVTVSGQYTNFVQGSTVANFGAGVSVGGAAQGVSGPVTVTSSTTATAQLVIDAAATIGARTVSIATGAQTASLTAEFSVVPPPPTITGFSPQSGPVGTPVSITGTNFVAGTQVSMPSLGGGSITLPLQSFGPLTVSALIPSGAVTGLLTVSTPGGSAATATSFSVNAANTFTLSASPAAATLIQGQSIAYTVGLSSTNGFNQLAQLSLAGLPSGITASFKPAAITAGQSSVLTLTAPANQPVTSTNISITAAATVNGIPQSQSASASLAVTGPTTTLIGRTVVTDTLETPIAGVTVTSLGQDGNGNTTPCTGHSTVSDSAGNFILSNLPAQCAGPQLFRFDGTVATAPAGKYAGVNLIFTLVQGQVTVSPVLVHLPRIDNAETFLVTQNSSSNQTHAFTTIPGLSATVYAGTTLTMPDGTQPNPFPLVAVQVPIDRLADAKPNVPTMVRVFLASFQPENSTASQPIAVSYPNVSNTPVGTDMVLMTLDPTHGTMVPYGTGAVSADGTQVVPDPDPAHPGHLYGLVHLDWFGQMPPPDQPAPGPDNCAPGDCGSNSDGSPPTDNNNQPPQCSGGGSGGGSDCSKGKNPHSGEPVDLASGLEYIAATDISVRGSRGTISVQRIYRTLSSVDGPFGLGTQIQYGWLLDSGSPNTAAGINLITPDGNRLLFSRQGNGTLTNSTSPSLQGAVMTTSTNNHAVLRLYDGTVYQFVPEGNISYLISVTDRNNNTTSLSTVLKELTTGVFVVRITKITDPVGRSLNLTYDSNEHATSITDPVGRTVSYTYNPSGTLATATDPGGGVTQYQYDSQNRMTSMTDARGVAMFQNTFDANGRVSQQIQPDGGVITFAYTLANPVAPTSRPIVTAVTDALGNTITYRFNIQGYLTDVTDAIGQTKTFARDPATNQLLQVTGPAQCQVCGPLGQGTTSYTYDAQGNKITSTDALGNTTHYTYDSIFNQVTSITDALAHTRTFGYDSFGNLTSVTDENGHTSTFSYDSNGLLLQVTDPLSNRTAIAYDGNANPASVTDALGNVSKTVFDPISRPVYATDPLGRTTGRTYDALNRVVSFQDGSGNTSRFSFDPVGNLLTLTDPRGNATAFTYDSANRVTARTSALGKTENYQYDLNGNVVRYTDRRGQLSRFQYDALNRLVNESYQDGATVIRSYDPYSRLLTVNDSVGGLFGFGYDLNGNLVSQNEPTGSIGYTRDPLHRVATRQVAGQSTVAYSYDPAGNLLSAAMPAAAISYSYDARNLPASASRTNGVNTSYAFDPLGRVLSLIHSNGATAINTQSYTYDPSGNRNSAFNDISQPLITQAATASVDQANELLTNGATSYTYDLNGNRLTEIGASGTLTYLWDSRNRLSSITDSGGNVTSFKYDFLRNLLELDRTGSSSATSQKFVVDSLTNVVSLTDASGLPISVLTGRLVDSHYASIDAAGNVDFGIADAIGSTVGVTNASGTITAKVDYEPFGLASESTPTSFPFAYTGRIPILGSLYYHRTRIYDAITGRFLSEDPLGLIGGTNAYAYVDDDPINFVDSFGLQGYSENVVPGGQTLTAAQILANFKNATEVQDALLREMSRIKDSGEFYNSEASQQRFFRCEAAANAIQQANLSNLFGNLKALDSLSPSVLDALNLAVQIATGK